MAKRVIGALCVASLLSCSVAARPSVLHWTLFRDDSKTTVLYPRDLFSFEERRPEGNRQSRVFTTSDRRASLQVFAYPNDRNESPGQHLNRIFPHDRRVLDYDRVTSRFFAISENKGDRIPYRRCNFSGDLIRCINLEYPRNEKRQWDDIVTKISLSLRPR